MLGILVVCSDSEQVSFNYFYRSILKSFIPNICFTVCIVYEKYVKNTTYSKRSLDHVSVIKNTHIHFITRKHTCGMQYLIINILHILLSWFLGNAAFEWLLG